MKKYLRGLLLLVALLGNIVFSSTWAQTFGESILIEQSVSKDLYLAGRDIDILATVDGDVTAAGQRVTIDGQVNRDVIAAGERVVVRGVVQDDLRAAGRTVSVTGDVFGHVVAAGQVISIGPDTVIGDWAWLAGETIDVTGSVTEELKVVGRTILIDGEIHGNTELIGQDIRIGPTGKIHGDLIWRSPNPLNLSEKAEIGGQLIEKPYPRGWVKEHEHGIGSYIFLVLSLIVGAVVLYFLSPGFSTKAAGLVRTEPLKCLGLGMVVLFVTPFVCLLLFATAIGYLLGLALLAAYLSFLVVGLLMAIIAVGDFGLGLVKKREAATRLTWVMVIVVTAIVLGLLWKIPYLGGLIFILVWLCGLGCVKLALIRELRQVKL